jgi:hypothetical protein
MHMHMLLACRMEGHHCLKARAGMCMFFLTQGHMPPHEFLNNNQQQLAYRVTLSLSTLSRQARLSPSISHAACVTLAMPFDFLLVVRTPCIPSAPVLPFVLRCMHVSCGPVSSTSTASLSPQQQKNKNATTRKEKKSLQLLMHAPCVHIVICGE